MPADFADRTDFENANRGLVARLEPGVIKAADGRVVYDADAFARTLAGDGPETVTQLFDSLAIRVDGKRAWDTTASIRWHFTDTGETYRMELSNGALIHYPTSRAEPADLTVTLTRPQLLALLSGAGTNGAQFDGDPEIFATIAWPHLARKSRCLRRPQRVPSSASATKAAARGCLLPDSSPDL